MTPSRLTIRSGKKDPGESLGRGVRRSGSRGGNQQAPGTVQSGAEKGKPKVHLALMVITLVPPSQATVVVSWGLWSAQNPPVASIDPQPTNFLGRSTFWGKVNENRWESPPVGNEGRGWLLIATTSPLLTKVHPGVNT